MPTPTPPDDTKGPEPGGADAPEQADVVIIGGSLTGIAAALFLAERGTSVTLLEARDRLGDGASGRHLGHVSTGLIEHPYRLVHALGPSRTRALYAFSQANQALLQARVDVVARGGWWAATDAREPEQLRASATALARLGVPHRLAEGDEVDATLGTSGLRSALRFDDDLVIDPEQAVGALARAARAAGAHLAASCPVREVAPDGDGVVVRFGPRRDREVRAEVVVFAAEAWLPGIEPWFGDKITPVREQALSTGPIPPLPVPAGRAGYGYTFWRQRADGSLHVGGCRWATPHLEVGERDDTVVVDVVQQRIEGFLTRHLPQARDLPISSRWSWIVGHACDGVPIVGPLPGAPRLVACAGFGANEPGLGIAAARAVTDGLLGEEAGAGPRVVVPDYFAASRFV